MRNFQKIHVAFAFFDVNFGLHRVFCMVFSSYHTIDARAQKEAKKTAFHE